jgi:hypothetical protein
MSFGRTIAVMKRKAALIAPLFLLPLCLHGAGDEALDRATLRGLKAVNVVADRLAPEVEDAGVTREALQLRLEGRLRDAGIAIDKAASEFVALRVLHVRGNRGPFGLCLTEAVYQPVLLSRDRNVHTATQTWEVQTVLLAEPKQLYRATMDSLDELADRFIAAYRSENGK